MQNRLIRIAAISGALAVALGAMGAHALKGKISPEMLQVFETGSRYQFYHSLALLAVALLMERNSSKFLRYSGGLFILGIVLFSGSLYFLSLQPLLGMENMRWIGAITPLGGLCFIAGWLFLAIPFSGKSSPQS
jgi:uncharacterized membrane protein YgdD (TMEM256/DUF423 family)